MRSIATLFGTRRSRIVVWAVAGVVIVAAATTWFLARSDAEQTSSTTTAEVTSTTIEDTVSGSGTLEAAKSEELSFSSSGTVTSVKVEAGDTVKKGEVLARIDTVTLKANLASAEAQLDAAETTAANDGDESSAQRAANNAAVASAEADVAEAEEALDDATLVAPFAGMVADVGLEVGDQTGSSSSAASSASTSSSTSTGTITVISPKRFVLTADVTADDVQRIEKGMQAEITPTDATEAVFGTVTEVGKVAEVGTTGTATFPVTITLTGEQEGLYAGTSADVSIIVESRDDVLTVPTAAVTTSGEDTYVQKLVDGKAVKTKVEIGDTFGMSTEIVSGLAEGDSIQYTQTARMPGGTSGSSETGEMGGMGGMGEMPSGGGMPAGGFPGGNQ